jgi:hypothetical protein
MQLQLPFELCQVFQLSLVSDDLFPKNFLTNTGQSKAEPGSSRILTFQEDSCIPGSIFSAPRVMNQRAKRNPMSR